MGSSAATLNNYSDCSSPKPEGTQEVSLDFVGLDMCSLGQDEREGYAPIGRLCHPGASSSWMLLSRPRLCRKPCAR
jgi:hypothetical protein